MKMLYSLLVLCLVIGSAACTGANPTGPTDLFGPSVGNTVSSSFSVNISPSSVTMGAGSSQMFTASAPGQYTQFLWTPAQPETSFYTDFAGVPNNKVMVTMRSRPSITSTVVKVEAFGVNGEYAVTTATINIRQ